MSSDTRTILLFVWGMAVVLTAVIQGLYTLCSGQNRSVWARIWGKKPSASVPNLSPRLIGGMLLVASLGFGIVLFQKFMELTH
jgi:hypothetical protein